MSFEPVPVLHVENGRFPEVPDADPEALLTDLSRRFGRVALVDAAGVRRNAADLEFLQRASRKRPVWVDAGSRYATDAMDLFIAGAEAVTLRWNTLRSSEELREAASLCQPGTLFLGLEFPKGGFLRHPKEGHGAPEVARLADSLGVGLVFFVEGADEWFLRSLPTGTSPRFVQGAADPDPARLQALGFQGVLLLPHQVPKEASP